MKKVIFILPLLVLVLGFTAGHIADENLQTLLKQFKIEELRLISSPNPPQLFELSGQNPSYFKQEVQKIEKNIIYIPLFANSSRKLVIELRWVIDQSFFGNPNLLRKEFLRFLMLCRLV